MASSAISLSASLGKRRGHGHGHGHGHERERARANGSVSKQTLLGHTTTQTGDDKERNATPRSAMRMAIAMPTRAERQRAFLRIAALVRES